MSKSIYYVKMYVTDKNGEYIVHRVYERKILEHACKLAQDLREHYREEFPLISVQYADNTVYADYEL